jgi:hypothetical protein
LALLLAGQAFAKASPGRLWVGRRSIARRLTCAVALEHAAKGIASVQAEPLSVLLIDQNLKAAKPFLQKMHILLHI